MNYGDIRDKFELFEGKDFRPHQEEAIDFAVQSDKPIVVIQAPTGFGKSLSAVCTGASGDRFTYLVSSKQLQNQLQHDFPEMAVMKGRNNYPCLKIPGAKCDECVHSKATPCDKKRDCIYEVQKKWVLNSKYRLLNYHYFLFETNFVGKFSDQPMVICDEGDLLEGLLAGFVSLTIPGRMVRQLNINPPKYLTTSSEFSVDNWRDWARDVYQVAKGRADELEERVDNGHAGADESKELKSLKSIAFQSRVFIDNVDKTWIFEARKPYKNSYGPPTLTFKPTWISEELSEQFFFRHGDKFVLMSATFPPSQILGKLLGRPPGDFDYYQAPSSFPVSNRPVFLNPVADLTKKKMDKNPDMLDKVLDEVLNLAAKHLDEKGVVHTVSYKITQAIMDQGLDRFITHNSSNREEIIDEFIHSDRPLILVSPSSDRGIDLPDDLCRWIVWVKAPFLSLGDKLTAKRTFSGQIGGLWYKSLTAQTIVQGCGRGVRHREDYCVTYCLDQQIYNLILQKGVLFPEYFREAVEII